MRELIAGKGIRPGVKLDEYILSVFPSLTKNNLYMAFRKKDVKVAGRRAAAGTPLAPLDVVQIYLPDYLLFGTENHAPASGFSVAYEDERLLIANKPQGLSVHPDRNGSGVTLVELVSEYCGTAPDYKPALCHRIDRNTGGLVVFAKDKGALDAMLRGFSGGSIIKGYRCVVSGRPEPPGAELRSYMTKDASQGIVNVYKNVEGAPPHAKETITRYETIGYDPTSDAAKLEVSIKTGRTHQIRAQLASIGHPIIGDGKYCPNAINKRYSVRFQMLAAYKLAFLDIPGLDISGTTVEIPDGLAYPELKL